MFKVSVIVPVYNAENFLEDAVESAVHLDTVREVILVEDASPDNALAICKQLEKKYKKVKLYRHPNNENRGAGASRNLGIEKANSDYIAFLDADDWYEPNRFEVEEQLLPNNEVDGVYGATGFYYESSKSKDTTKLTTISETIRPEDLLFEFVKPNGGRFTTDAITYNRVFLLSIGLFQTDLRLHQDSELFIRSLVQGNLVNGICDRPIAFRRVHPNNRISNPNKDNHIRYFKKVVDYLMQSEKRVEKRVLRVLLKSLIISLSEGNDPWSRAKVVLTFALRKPIWLIKII